MIKKIDTVVDAAKVAEKATWKSASQLTSVEANRILDQSLPAGVKVDTIGNADSVNAAAQLKGYDSPLIPGTHVVDMTTTRPTEFVRVYAMGSDSKQVGSWMMRADDVAGLSAEQMARKFSLPQVPNMITDVTVPAGNKLQASVANDILEGTNGGGGGVQFQVQSRPVKRTDFEKWFTNPRPLK